MILSMYVYECTHIHMNIYFIFVYCGYVKNSFQVFLFENNYDKQSSFIYA